MKTTRTHLLHATPLALALAQGCAPESAIDQQAEEVVGGTTTTARPEVGQFYRAPTTGSSGGSCTATLIGSRYVMTASHCLNVDNYQDAAVRNGDRFVGAYADGSSYSFAVDRIHSYGNYRREYTPGGTMTTDIAILRLAQRPPTPGVGVALTQGLTPAPLALLRPVNGATSTLFGYGCTSRATRAGSGPKQRIDFSYGSTTAALCWGDSGGPVFASGLIWGVNSDFASNNVTATTADVFADVPYFRGRIGSLVDLWQTNDFDENGTPDVLWENRDTQQLSVWFMQDNNVLRDQVFAGPGAGFHPVATGDFNRDDRRDILMYNRDTGALRVWLMNGATRTGELAVSWSAAASSGWRLVTAADFDRDGKSDIVWFHPASGTVSVWFMDGGTVRFDRYMSWTAGAASPWTPHLAADFDRDGNTDLLWTGPGGALGVWYLEGTTVRTDGRISRSLAAFDTRSPVGAGDFDRDDKVDVMFRDSATGALTVWYLDGVTYRAERNTSWSVPGYSPWQVVSR